MSVVLKRSASTVEPSARANVWLHIVWFAVAGLFVSILALTYGLDLSPGFF